MVLFFLLDRTLLAVILKARKEEINMPRKTGVTINVVVPDETRNKFKIACIKAGKSQKEILIRLIDGWIKKKG